MRLQGAIFKSIEDSGGISVHVSHVLRKHLTLFAIVLCSVSPSLVLASDRNTGSLDFGLSQLRSDFYGELHFGANGIRHSDLDFFPLFASVTAGAFVLPNIGIEVFADLALAEEDNAGFDVELTSALGIAARFQSPPWQGLSGYVVLGVVDYTVTQSPQNASIGGGSIEEDFFGVRVSVGVIQQLKRLPKLSVSAEWRSYAVDEPIRVDSLVIGLRITP